MNGFFAIFTLPNMFDCRHPVGRHFKMYGIGDGFRSPREWRATAPVLTSPEIDGPSPGPPPIRFMSS